MKDIFLVDVDDTILDFHGASHKALIAGAEACGVVWNGGLLEKYRVFNDGLWAALERGEISRDELMEERFPRFFKHLNMPNVDGRAFNKIYVNYIATQPIFFDGAKEFLNCLNERGRVYFVTNGTEWIQKSRFDIAGLWGYAVDTFISERVGYHKPEKGFTDYVIEHVENFEKERAVWIGDSLSADIKAANEANITSIWFNPNNKTSSAQVKPDFIAKNFDEILKILF